MDWMSAYLNQIDLHTLDTGTFWFFIQVIEWLYFGNMDLLVVIISYSFMCRGLAATLLTWRMWPHLCYLLVKLVNKLESLIKHSQLKRTVCAKSICCLSKVLPYTSVPVYTNIFGAEIQMHIIHDYDNNGNYRSPYGAIPTKMMIKA